MGIVFILYVAAVIVFVLAAAGVPGRLVPVGLALQAAGLALAAGHLG